MQVPALYETKSGVRWPETKRVFKEVFVMLLSIKEIRMWLFSFLFIVYQRRVEMYKKEKEEKKEWFCMWREF